ncbi:hypothetical protein D3C85_1353010 [compost metagenome]
MRENDDFDMFKVAVLLRLVVKKLAPHRQAAVAVDDKAVLIEQQGVDLLVSRILEIAVEVRKPTQL